MHGRVVFDPAPAACDPAALQAELVRGLERLGAQTTQGASGVRFHVPLKRLTTDSPLGLASTGEISLIEDDGKLVVAYALNQLTMCLAFGVVVFGMTALFLYLDETLPKELTLAALGLGFVLPAVVSALLTGLEFREFLRACMAHSLCASQVSWQSGKYALFRVRWAKDEPALEWVSPLIRVAVTLELLPVVSFFVVMGAFLDVTLRGIPEGSFLLFGIGSAFVCGLRFFLVRGNVGRLRRGVGRSMAKARLGGAALTDLAQLASVEDGTLVRCRGRVRVKKTLPGLFVGTMAAVRFVEAVFRLARPHKGRVELHVVHEAGEEFDLVDARGAAVRVDVARGQVLAPSTRARLLSLPQMARILDLPFPGKGTGTVTGEMWAEEWLLRDGHEVEILAQKRGDALASPEEGPLLILPR
jgi:hypothetical protein